MYYIEQRYDVKTSVSSYLNPFMELDTMFTMTVQIIIMQDYIHINYFINIECPLICVHKNSSTLNKLHNILIFKNIPRVCLILSQKNKYYSLG